MKKSLMPVVSLVVLSFACATGFGQATAESVGGGTSSSAVTSSTSPSPMGVGGGNPRPSTGKPSAPDAIVALLSAIGAL